MLPLRVINIMYILSAFQCIAGFSFICKCIFFFFCRARSVVSFSANTIPRYLGALWHSIKSLKAAKKGETLNTCSSIGCTHAFFMRCCAARSVAISNKRKNCQLCTLISALDTIIFQKKSRDYART